MPGLDKNRKRNKTVCFRMSPSELDKLNTRIKISNLSKREFFGKMLLEGRISIRVGKYESDLLSLELRKLSDKLGKHLNIAKESDVLVGLNECRTLLDTLMNIIKYDKEDNMMKSE